MHNDPRRPPYQLQLRTTVPRLLWQRLTHLLGLGASGFTPTVLVSSRTSWATVVSRALWVGHSSCTRFFAILQDLDSSVHPNAGLGTVGSLRPPRSRLFPPQYHRSRDYAAARHTLHRTPSTFVVYHRSVHANLCPLYRLLGLWRGARAWECTEDSAR